MVLLWAILGLLVAYLVYGALVPTGYRRVFSADLPADQLADGYLVPHEVHDPDEPSLSARISEAFANDSLRRPRNAGRDDPMFHEPHWGHTGAILRGTLDVDAVDALPARFRVGLFARNASYPVVARSGVVKDPDLGFAVHRLALKLRYPDAVPNVYATGGEANELDLLLVAGEARENGEGHAFFARDARQLDMATTLKPPSMRTVRTFANWRNLAMLARILARVKTLMKPMRRPPNSNSGWAGKPYFSLGPFALGEGAMKFSLSPRQSHDVPDTDPMTSDIAAVNRDAMAGWLARGEDAVFTLSVQLATPDSLPDPGPGDPPKSVMAAEYCDLHWDEARAPYLPVGTLTLQADAAINTPDIWASLQFNAWNTLPEMRPLGQLFRVRRDVHSAHSTVRVGHLFGAEPGRLVGKCPFSG